MGLWIMHLYKCLESTIYLFYLSYLLVCLYAHLYAGLLHAVELMLMLIDVQQRAGDQETGN